MNDRRFKDKKEMAEPEADPERDQRTVFAYQVDDLWYLSLQGFCFLQIRFWYNFLCKVVRFSKS